MHNIIELEWDSRFFNLKIGKLVLDQTDDCYLESLLQESKNQGFDLLYVFTKVKIDGIKFVDQKRLYICNTPECNKVESLIEDFHGNSDLLYDLAYQAGHKSRFRIDPTIPEEDFKRLYQLWIDNSLNGSFADYVKVYFENGKPIGFITAKKKSDKLSIGLVAVDGESRGKGIGRKLLSSIIMIAAENNLPIEVATQADNTGACKFYEQMGFTINEETYIYHIWNK